MSWYSGDWNKDLKGQFYIPYKTMGRPNSDKAIEDFKNFRKTEQILFEDDLPKMY